MRHRNEFDIERPDIDARTGLDNGDRNLRRTALRRTLGLEQRGAELGRVDRALEFRPQIDDGAEMILMGVREHQAHQVLAFLLEEGHVRHHQIDAGQMLLVAERHAEIDREEAALLAVAETVDRQVHADLADTAERGESQFVGSRHYLLPVEPAVPK